MINKTFQNSIRSAVLFLFYCILLFLPQYLAFWVRFGGTMPFWSETLISRMAPWSILSYLIVFSTVYLYKGRTSFRGPWTWSMRDIIVAALGKLSIFYVLVHWIFEMLEYPRSVLLIEPLLFVLFCTVLSKFEPITRNVCHAFDRRRIRDVGLAQGRVELENESVVGSFYAHGALLVVIAVVGFTSDQVMRQGILPYSNQNPVIYDNDDVVDVYTDDYIMALASAGTINLVGMMTSTSVAPFNRYGSPEGFEEGAARRTKGVVHARNSGFGSIPDPVRGPMGHLRKPASGQLQDTQPIGSSGSRLIVDAARKAPEDKPLVVVVGGPLTAVADAYLLDNSIRDRLIVAWLGGTDENMADYNGWADPWAAYIVLRKLRLVQFPGWNIGMLGSPQVPKRRLYELPDSELRRWMIDKYLPTNGLPAERDADAPPAISLIRPDYVIGVKRVSFSHWVTVADLARDMNVEDTKDREFPAFKEDPDGPAMVVTHVVKSIATDEWWRAMTNVKAWNAFGASLAAGDRSLY